MSEYGLLFVLLLLLDIMFVAPALLLLPPPPLVLLVVVLLLFLFLLLLFVADTCTDAFAAQVSQISHIQIALTRLSLAILQVYAPFVSGYQATFTSRGHEY